jgi:hypothetical protein
MSSPSPPPRRPEQGRRARAWAAALCLTLALVPGGPAVRPSTGTPAGLAAPGEPGRAAPSPADAAEERIAGRVVDPRGTGIAGARVRAIREPGDAPPGGVAPGDDAREIATDAVGAFALGLPRGRWLIRAAGTGFSDTATVVDVPGSGEITLTLAAVGRIAGQVFGVDGAPAPADIVLAGSGVWPARTVRAGADGRFVLEAVPPGIYEVQARGESGSAEPRRGLEIAAGGRAILSFHLAPGETMLGRVVDAETEAPIASAEIVVMEEALGVAPRALRTSADGSFRIVGLRDQSHSLTIHADGYVPVIARTWEPGEALQVTMERGATLSGVVLDGRRRPIAGARLEVLGEMGDHQPIAMEGARVAFRGEVFRSHEEVGHELATVIGALPVTDDVPAIPLAPPPGSETAFASIAPPSGARSTIAAMPTNAAFVTAGDGTFTITGVPPGHVQVTARQNGYAPASSDRIWVAAGGERRNVEIVLSPAGRIEGRVLDERGRGAGEILIEHRSDAEPWPRVTFTDDRGAFTLSDVAGAVTLRAMLPGRAPIQVRVDVAPGAAERTTIQIPPPGVTFAGRTVDRSGRPIEAAQVRIESMAPGDGASRTVITDPTGRFTLDDAPPGPWRVTADHADYAQAAPIDVDAEGLEAGGREGVRIVVEDGVSATGTVIDRMLGGGVAEAELVLEREGAPPILRTARTDENGAFLIPRALAGTYRARIAASGYRAWEGPLVITSSRRGEVELDAIELESGARIEGDVVDALGRVVRGARIAIEGEPRAIARSDAQGHFALANAGAGSIVLRADHPAAGEIEHALVVHAGRDPAPMVLRLPGRFDPASATSERALRHGVATELTTGQDGAIEIASVVPGSRAEAAGLRAGDLLRAVDGEEVADAGDAERALRGADGVSAVLEVERVGEVFRVRVARETW